MHLRIQKSALTLFILLVISTLSASAKTAEDVSATVKDSQTKQPVEFATVEFLSVNDTVLAGCITDSKGYFEMTPPVGVEKVRIRYLGYKPFEGSIKERDLGVLLLDENSKELNAVIVQGSVRMNRIDRDVYIVTKELRAGTISSQEILGKLNGVTYNRYDKSIAVNGSSNILILIDGIEKDQDMANNLPSDRIERVEVIKDPVGKYATDGYTAVINIVLKKDYSGVDAFITNTTFFNFAGSNGGDIFTQDAGNMNISYTHKKLNLFSSGRMHVGNFNVPTQIVKQYGNLTSKSEPMDVAHPNTTVDPRFGKINVGADYAFSKKHLLSAEFRYSGNKETSISRHNMINSVNNLVIDSSFSFSNTQSLSENWQGTLTYKGKLDDQNTFDVDFRFNHTEGFNKNTFQQDLFSNSTHILQHGNYARLNINYIRQFSSLFNLEVGYGNVYNQNTNALQANNFTQNEYRNRISAYVSYKPSLQLNAKMGGILEYYIQKNKSNREDNTVLLPFVNVQYVPHKNINIVAKYHAQSQYPDIDQLSTFRTAQDSLTWNVGNPLLKTSIDHALSVEINLMRFITITPYYTFDRSRISSFVQVDPQNNNHYLSQFVNADTYERYGTSINFTMPFGKRIFWQNSMDWNRNRIAYLAENFALNNFTYNTSLVYVNEKSGLVTGAVLQKMQSKDLSVQGYTSDGNNILLAFLQKSFLNQKLNVSLLYILPANFLKYDQPSVTRTTSYYQSTTASLNLIKNLAFIELSYRFNAGKQITKKHSDDDNEIKKPKKGGIGI